MTRRNAFRAAIGSASAALLSALAAAQPPAAQPRAVDEPVRSAPATASSQSAAPVAAASMRDGSVAAGDSSASAHQMTAAAVALLASLSSAERATVVAPLAGGARTDWSNVPGYAHRRPGLKIGDLDTEKKLRVHDLLRASLSSQGYQKVAGVMRLDDVNSVQQRARLAADADAYTRGVAASFGSANYFLSIFGEPGKDAQWAWLIQGHHLGVSFTVAGERVAFLPMFLGATPLAVAESMETGWSALPHEVSRGVELMRSLSPAQRARAYSAEAVPADVLNGVGNKHRLTPPDGLRAAEMTPLQQRLLRALVEEYVRNADFDAADEQLDAIAAAGWDALTFSWRGSVEDLDAPFYYRVQGPRIVIELRNSEDHIHTIVRDPQNDYGETWLGVEYREPITAAERSAAARRAAQ
jgi:hypothetical protein